MSTVHVSSFGLSLDGYGAGVDQSLEQPLGAGFPEVMAWFMATRTFREMLGQPDGETGVDNTIAAEALQGNGAWILGRNMFAASRGPWTNDGWKGWWGANPPYHVPTFILTHHPRADIVMEGGTPSISSPAASMRRWNGRGTRPAAGGSGSEEGCPPSGSIWPPA